MISPTRTWHQDWHDARPGHIFGCLDPSETHRSGGVEMESVVFGGFAPHPIVLAKGSDHFEFTEGERHPTPDLGEDDLASEQKWVQGNDDVFQEVELEGSRDV